MMDAVRNGRINCIIVKDLSRFGRNYLEAGHYIEHVFPFLNVRFIAVTDGFDTLTATPAQLSYLIPLKNIMNENYARDISKKERSAKKVLMKIISFMNIVAKVQQKGIVHIVRKEYQFQIQNIIRMGFVNVVVKISSLKV